MHARSIQRSMVFGAAGKTITDDTRIVSSSLSTSLSTLAALRAESSVDAVPLAGV